MSVKTVEDGQLVEWARFNYVVPQQPAYSCSGVQPYPAWQSHFIAMQFDDAYSRMAVGWQDASDGTRRVGWLTASGALVDITERTAGTGFSSAAADHGNPVFDPNTDEFTYHDRNTGEQVWVDDTGTLLRKEAVGPERSPYIWLDGKTYSADSNPMVSGPCGALPTPDGSGVFIAGISGTPIVNIGSAGFFANINNIIHFVERAPSGSTWDALPSDLKGPSCVQLGTPITPPSDFAIGNGVISPDGSTLLFVAGRNEARFAFSVPVGGGQEPVQEFNMPRGAYGFDTYFAEWR